MNKKYFNIISLSIKQIKSKNDRFRHCQKNPDN